MPPPAQVTDEPERDINPDTECYCDFIQIIEDDGDQLELHHVIPDDGMPHEPDTDCDCSPDIHRVDYDYIVVDHRDQDQIDPALAGEH